jgi:DNA invertase Pin-like site-specific DNA recombinase
MARRDYYRPNHVNDFKEPHNRSSAHALAYLRTSTEDQNLGLDAQLEEIMLWSQVNNIKIAKVFQDQISGSSDFDERPGWTELVAYQRRFRQEFIVASRRDRFARDMYYLTKLERTLPPYVQLVTAQETPEMHITPERMMIRGVLDVMSQYELNLIRSRTRRALAALKSKGVKLGRPPVVRKLREAKLPDVEREVRYWRGCGRSLRWIVNHLNEQEFAGRRWHLTQVCRILKNEQQ